MTMDRSIYVGLLADETFLKSMKGTSLLKVITILKFLLYWGVGKKVDFKNN